MEMIMKKISLVILCLIASSTVQANTPTNNLESGPHFSGELSPGFSQMKYDEFVRDEAFVNEDGTGIGLYAALTYWDNQYIRLILDTYLAHTEFNYTSKSGDSAGNPNNLFEIRGVLGHDFYFLHSHRITPYLGAGYRRFADNSGGMLTNLGAVAYDRRSNYYYSPLGAEISVYHQGLLEVLLIGEYDFLWKGYQKSDDVDSKFFEINEQDNGYGFKLRLRFVKQSRRNTKVVLEPYYTYWHVKDSSINCNPYVCVLEPLNTFKEYGLRIGFLFANQ